MHLFFGSMTFGCLEAGMLDSPFITVMMSVVTAATGALESLLPAVLAHYPALGLPWHLDQLVLLLWGTNVTLVTLWQNYRSRYQKVQTGCELWRPALVVWRLGYCPMYRGPG